MKDELQEGSGVKIEKGEQGVWKGKTNYQDFTLRKKCSVELCITQYLAPGSIPVFPVEDLYRCARL